MEEIGENQYVLSSLKVSGGDGGNQCVYSLHRWYLILWWNQYVLPSSKVSEGLSEINVCCLHRRYPGGKGGTEYWWKSVCVLIASVKVYLCMGLVEISV